MTDAMNPYLDTHQDKCILTESAEAQRRGPIMFFKMVPAENVTKITCSKEWKSLHIYKNRSDIPITSMLGGRGLEKVSDSSLFLTRNRRAVVKEIPPAPPVLDSAAGGGGCGQMTLPLTSTFKDGVYSFSFNVSRLVFCPRGQLIDFLPVHRVYRFGRGGGPLQSLLSQLSQLRLFRRTSCSKF